MLLYLRKWHIMQLDLINMEERSTKININMVKLTSTEAILVSLLQQKLDVVVIETGANDGLRGVPVQTMRSNLKQIITRIRASQPAAVIALIQMEAMPNMGRIYTESFREAFPSLAREEKVTLMPFLLDGVAGIRDLNQGDGIHPNEEGERIVAQNVWKALKPLLQ